MGGMKEEKRFEILLEGIQGDLATVLEVATSNSKDMIILKNDMATLKDDVVTLKDDVVTLKKGMSSLEGKIDKMDSRLERVEVKVDNLEDVAGLVVNDHTEQLQDHETRLAKVENQPRFLRKQAA
jgi:predicted  nucleic acid-binding Zn-ribbon protein